MHTKTTLRQGAAAFALALGSVAPAGATTLVRASVEDLTAGHDTIVVGEVLGASSYWNWEGTSILTDVRVAPSEVLKGRVDGHELNVTLMGGAVDDIASVVIGAAQLVPGQSYVLFLNQDDLPGAAGVMTVRAHCQGAFDLVPDDSGVVRAVSQASRLALRADRRGRTDVPGGPDGMALPELRVSIRDAVRRGDATPELKP